MDNFWDNFNFREWLLQNILWVIFFSVILGTLYKLIVSFVKAVIVSKKILRENRDTRGNGLGKYYTDRFIQICYSREPVRYMEGQDFPFKFGLNSRHWTSAIDQDLQKFGLVDIDDDISKRYKAVKPVINLRNKLVLFMTKFYLIHFIGDKKQYYKDLQK